MINLLLLTVSFTASAKITCEANNKTADAGLISNVPYYAIAESSNGSMATYRQATDNSEITRGGFGDKKHSGAEQSQHTDEKK